MKFSEFVQAVAALAGDRYYSAAVEAVRGAYFDGLPRPFLTVQWAAYVDGFKHGYGATPEEAVAALKGIMDLALGLVPSDDVMDVEAVS